MKIIVEGADGSGKSTVVNYLARTHNCDVVHMTRWGSRNPYDYKSKHCLNNIILDRSFMSEMVYKQAFGLKPQISFEEFDELMKDAKNRDCKIIILTAPTETLKSRLRIRGNEDEEIIKNIGFIDNLYRSYAMVYDIPIFDTTEMGYLSNITEEIMK